MKISADTLNSYKALLRGVRFFEGVGVDDLEKLLEAAEIVLYNMHEYIIEERDVDFSFFVILKGKVKLIKGSEDQHNKKELWYLQRGDCFGEMGLLLKSCRTASILAAEQCYIFKISGKAINKMPESTKGELYKRIAMSLAEKLKATTEYVVSPYFF